MWELAKHRGKFVAYQRIDGKAIRRSLSTKDKLLAKQRLLDLNQLSKDKNGTVDTIYKNYVQSKEGQEEAKKLIIMWKPLSEVFSGLRGGQVNRELCTLYIQKRRAEGKSDNTIIRELGGLRAALRYKDKALPKSFKMPPKPEPKDHFLTKEEYYRLLSSAETPHMKLFIILALATGARTSAILQLEWCRVDFERKLIDLGRGTHNKRRATVPMNNTAYEALKKAYNARLSEYVIEYGGKPIKWVSKGFRTVAKNAGLEGATPHILRHTAAVWMAEAGVQMEEIAQYLGHSTPEITYKVYARYSPNYLRKAANALELCTDVHEKLKTEN